MSYTVKPCETIVRSIPDYENYTIDIYGDVMNTKTGRTLKTSLAKGYPSIILCKNGVCKHFNIHRLLGIVFLKCPSDALMDHKDCNRSNNDLMNLRVCTPTENSINRKGVKGIRLTRTGKYEYWNGLIRINGKQIQKCFPYTDEGKQQAYHWRVNKEIEHFKEFASKVKVNYT